MQHSWHNHDCWHCRHLRRPWKGCLEKFHCRMQGTRIEPSTNTWHSPCRPLWATTSSRQLLILLISTFPAQATCNNNRRTRNSGVHSQDVMNVHALGVCGAAHPAPACYLPSADSSLLFLLPFSEGAGSTWYVRAGNKARLYPKSLLITHCHNSGCMGQMFSTPAHLPGVQAQIGGGHTAQVCHIIIWQLA